MQRRLFLAALVLAVLALSAKWLVNGEQKSPGLRTREISYSTEYSGAPLSSSPSPAARLQAALDQVAGEAERGNWPGARLALRELESFWQSLRLEQEKLQLEKEIGRGLEDLREQVWAQDREGVLQAAGELTKILRQLTA